MDLDDIVEFLFKIMGILFSILVIILLIIGICAVVGSVF